MEHNKPKCIRAETMEATNEDNNHVINCVLGPGSRYIMALNLSLPEKKQYIIINIFIIIDINKTHTHIYTHTRELRLSLKPFENPNRNRVSAID